MAVEAIVSALLNRLLPVIENSVSGQVSLLFNTDKKVKALHSKLETIRKVLDNAVERGITEPQVKSWLDELREIAYKVHCILDKWEVENIAQEGSNVVRSFCCFFRKTVGRRRIALAVRRINKRLDTVAQRNNDRFKFAPNLGDGDGTVSRLETTTTSFVDESIVRGRDSEKEIIKEKLLSEDLQVISIVGTGGMGKTTLAQIVFKEVKQEFDKAMWVYVSDPFDQIKVAKAILETLNKESPRVSNLEALLGKIEESVSGKKFFLVLDDVWTDDYRTWEPFRNALKTGSRGSRILVTTRKSTVAELAMASDYICELGLLSDSDCCSVLEQIAFSGRNSSSSSSSDLEQLRGVAMEIAKKCSGMPLAATIIGRLLSFKTSLNEWERVLQSKWWDKAIGEVFPFLRLSYNELHPEVKQCFSYCAIFPKGERIEVDVLVRTWRALGFLAEQEGLDCFRDLAARSLFQDFVRDRYDGKRVIAFRIHDVVRDFVRSLTDECLVPEDESNDGVSHHNIRHLNLEKANMDGEAASSSTTTNITTVLSSVSVENLHSLLLCRPHHGVRLDIFSQLKRVKQLKLSGCSLKDIPEEIGQLIHLRLLDLSDNPFEKLPKTICGLYYLQTLDISFCSKLSGLPHKIERLTNLTHILNGGFFSVGFGLHQWIKRLTNLTHIPNRGVGSVDFGFPMGFEKLTGLQTLESYHCNKLGYLKDMNNLGGSLSIRVKELSEDEAEQADLKSKKFLRILTLDLAMEVGYEVIESLRPHQNLQDLVVHAQKIPSWLTDNFDYLKKLRLQIYPNDKIHHLSLPCLGHLCSLEHLYMYGMDEMVRVDKEFLGIKDAAVTDSFPMLRRLEFHNCRSWEEWEDITEDEENNNAIRIFPCLEELRLKSCFKLKSLPARLLRKAPNLKRLEIIYCPHLRHRDEENDNRHHLSFPCLGRLRSLEHLFICGMTERVGKEFLGIDDAAVTESFPKLRSLSIMDCGSWEEWEDITEDEENNNAIRIFPCLEELRLDGCSKLKSLPARLLRKAPNLKRLNIVSHPEFSKDEEGEEEKDKRHHLSFPCLGRLRSLEHLFISGRTERVGKEFLGIDDAAVTESFPKLRILEFKNCGSWEEWDDITEDEENNNAIRIFPCLEELTLDGCGELKSLPIRLLRKAPNLKRSEIISCPHLRRRYEEEHIPHVEFVDPFVEY